MVTTAAGIEKKPIEIFISYSRDDLPFLKELRRSLKVFENEHGVRIWHDGNLTPGQEWEKELYERFFAAHIILLLVSPNFYNSEYCIQRELPAALDRLKKEKTRVVPVIIQAAPWKYSKLRELMVLPKDGKPVESWSLRSEAYENIAESLYPLFAEIQREIEGCESNNGRDEQNAETVEGQTWGASAPMTAPPQSASSNNSNPIQDVVGGTSWVKVNRPAGTPASSVTSSANIATLVEAVVANSANPTESSAVGGTASPPVVRPIPAERKLIIPDLLYCVLHPERSNREKLRSLRNWCREPKDPLFTGPAARLQECKSLEEAVACLKQNREGTILLLDGFEPSVPQLCELIRPGEVKTPFEVIVNSPEWESFAAQTPSASIMQASKQVTSEEMLFATLRKVVLKVRTRQFATARVIRTKEEFAAYFALRYQVWSELGYLSPDKQKSELPWELDFTDRMSLPFGLFCRTTGELLGAARLVRGFGEEYHQIVKIIEDLLREHPSKVLEASFRYPARQNQLPYDVLQEFREFQTYYEKLVRRGVAKAEVSRVIVAPEWRKSGFGEVIIDTLCSFAKAHSFQVLFLACHEKHESFYSRSGFRVIPGVTGDHFLSYKVPCLAMERELLSGDEVVS